MQWVPRNMSLWSSIAFTLAAITNLLVCLFYPFDKGSQLLGETHQSVGDAVSIDLCVLSHLSHIHKSPFSHSFLLFFVYPVPSLSSPSHIPYCISISKYTPIIKGSFQAALM